MEEFLWFIFGYMVMNGIFALCFTAGLEEPKRQPRHWAVATVVYFGIAATAIWFNLV